MPVYKNLALIGSTGSLGKKVFTQAMQTGRRITAVAAGGNVEELLKQAAKARPLIVVIGEEEKAEELERGLCKIFKVSDRPEVCCGKDGFLRVVETCDELAVTTCGLAGIHVCENALMRGRRLLLGSKEIAVVGGSAFRRRANETGCEIMVLDSELTAIVQLLKGRRIDDIRRVTLCASGGPFLGKRACELKNVSVDDTLNHPVWTMGKKVTVDSATLFNKAMEIMVANRLLGIPSKKLGAVIHPECRVHVFVETNDGAILFQAAPADMAWAVGYAMEKALCERCELKNAPGETNLDSFGCLTFLSIEKGSYPALDLGRKALEAGGAVPAFLAGADHVFVEEYLRDRLGFVDIIKGLNDLFIWVAGQKRVDPEDLDAMIAAWDMGGQEALNWIRGRKEQSRTIRR